MAPLIITSQALTPEELFTNGAEGLFSELYFLDPTLLPERQSTSLLSAASPKPPPVTVDPRTLEFLDPVTGVPLDDPTLDPFYSPSQERDYIYSFADNIGRREDLSAFQSFEGGSSSLAAQVEVRERLHEQEQHSEHSLKYAGPMAMNPDWLTEQEPWEAEDTSAIAYTPAYHFTDESDSDSTPRLSARSKGKWKEAAELQDDATVVDEDRLHDAQPVKKIHKVDRAEVCEFLLMHSSF